VIVRFLIDADLPYSLEPLIVAHGHDALHVRDVGLGGASDATIADFARTERYAILTGDFDFADIRHYPPADYFGIAVLVLTPRMVSSDIHALVRSFLERRDVVDTLAGKLAIVEMGRVRIRS
jgi:predicted nuclease of predicted toxin-antitoxin system